MSRTDVEQGQLGNCWFLAAAASLTLYPRLLQRVVPGGQSFAPGDYAGIFHFQFWQYGQWVDVVVDDRLPVRSGELVFVRSRQRNEFWMALLEKAYAKLSGSYEAMSGGYMNEAFVDFTGGVGESIPLKLPNPQLFEIIQAALRQGALMGTHIQVSRLEDSEGKTPEGLVQGHAYSVTGVHTLEGDGRRLKLLRLRNPWGEKEWTGRWSDDSPLWAGLQPQLRETLHVRKEDGEFWMQMDDFLRCFDALEICSLAGTEPGQGWRAACFQGRWRIGHTAGGSRSSGLWDGFWMNPQYHVRLRAPEGAGGCTLLVALAQRDRRRGRKQGQDFLPIGFEILEYLALASVSQRKAWLPKLRPVAQTSHLPMRDVAARHRLPPGSYLVVPSTGRPMQEGDFTLRVLTEQDHEALELDDEIRADLRPPQPIRAERELEQAFLKLAGPDKQMDVARLQDFLNEFVATRSHLRSDGFGPEVSRQILRHVDHDKTGKLRLAEFRHLCSKIEEWEGIFRAYDMDQSGAMNVHEMQLALDDAGFHLNHQLREAITRPFRDRYLQIDFDSFLSCMVQLEGVFRQCQAYDKTGAGTISLTQKEWLELATLT
ncbi:calpain-12 isoform X2 [Pelodiscus sinensis]